VGACVVQVTEANKSQYVDKMVDWKSGGECDAAISELAKGMFEVRGSPINAGTPSVDRMPCSVGLGT
jgi:hypothetical protein